MTVNSLTAALVVVCFAAPVAWVGAGVVTRRDGVHGVTIVDVSRQVTQDLVRMTVTAHFTAASPPQVTWTYQGADDNTAVVADQSLDFADGLGRATATLNYVKRVILKIGQFDSHFLEVSFLRDYDDCNITQSLAATGSALSSDYDIGYTAAGSSFDVTATVPGHITSGYSLSPDYGELVSVESCFVDQDTQKIVSGVDHLDRPYTAHFLNTEVESEETGLSVKMTFDTSTVDISGYFRIHTEYEIDDKKSPSLVDYIWETRLISVHDAATPGPFPTGYADIRKDHDDECERDDLCVIYCYGFANEIGHVAIIRDEDGTEMDLHVQQDTRHHVIFNHHLDTSQSFGGTYICRMEVPGGGVVEEKMTVVEV